MNNDFFTVRLDGDLRLINPSHSAAVGNAAWSASNLWWRSRVETANGDLVSQGYGKFFNLGQGPLDLNIGVTDVARAVEKGDALATLKLDGSLLIRSVHQGKAMFRTRGSFTYTHLDNAAEMDEFCVKHPKLVDPKFADNYSLLFEWTSPTNVIVLRYPEPKLTLIGAVDHRSMSYVRMAELKTFAEYMGIDLVEYFPLTAVGWADLYDSMAHNREIEGYVVRLNNEQDLVKIKCAHYLTKHALKSRLTTETLADMYFQYGRPNFTGFMEQFSQAFDEETGMWAMPVIASMYDGVREMEKAELHLRRKVGAVIAARDARLVAAKSWEVEALTRSDRKDFAIKAKNEYGSTKKFALAMAVYLGEMGKYNALLKSVLLQSTKQMELSFMKPGRDDLEDDA